MSKKRSNNRAATRRQPVQQVVKPKMLSILPLIARDGFANNIAFLGEASDLSKANDYQRNSISRDYELLTVLYRENWIAKRIIDMPCEDMTRSWYKVVSALNQDKLDELEKLEARHSVKQEITNGLRWARLYGGAAAVMVIKGQEDMLDQPLDYDDLMPGCFRGLIIVDRTNGLDPSVELEDDMDDPEFGYPKYYTVRLNDTNQSMVRVHHSRLLIFRGRMLPIVEEMTESYWGASELEHVYEELQKRNSTSANIAQLIFQANVGALKMADYGEVMGMGTEQQKQQIMEAVYAENRIRNSFGMMLMSNEDSYEQHAYSFSGLSEVYETFMMDMAGAAEIPATKLYGRSPQGMNATGESDMNNYYEMLAQLQERHLRPAIEKLLPVMAVSLWGKIPNDMKVVFEPMQVTTPAERASIMQQVTGVVIQAFSAGLIAQQPALIELQKFGKDIGFWESITDEMIEKAETEVDSGEGMGDPMGGMGGGMPGMPPEGGPDGGGMSGMPGMMPEEGEAPADTESTEEEPSEKSQNGPEQAPGEADKEMLANILKEAKGAQESEKTEADDGGPGSGNFGHPGYRRGGGLAPAGGEKKASIGERVRFLQDPTEGKNAPRAAHGPTGSKTHVTQMNRERKQWSNLTTGQKIKGNAEQQKHIAQMKADVIKAAMNGDLTKAREIVKANRHYWANDPDSAQKVQSETLKRQMAVKPQRRFLHDAFAAVLKMFSRDRDEEATDEEIWRTNEEGHHFSLETETGEIKAGFGGKFNGKKVGEEWEPGKERKPRASGGKVAAPPKVADPKSRSQKVETTFKNSPYGEERTAAVASGMAKSFKKTKKETESVFNNPSSTTEERSNAMLDLYRAVEHSDDMIRAKNGVLYTTSDYGIENIPKRWEYRLTGTEREVLAGIVKAYDESDDQSWDSHNREAVNAMYALQAKLLGAEVEPNLSDNLLKQYAGIEKREEVPGQQSMFYGENVPNENSAKNPSTPVAKEPEIHYNVGGAASGLAKTPAKQFRETFHKAKDAVAKMSPEKAWRVDSSYTDEDYEHMDCYTSPGGSCVAVHDGDIVSVCGMPGDKVRGSDLLKCAVQMGGKKLDAFSGLYGFYAKNGFEPVSWCEFEEQYAPPDWVKDRDAPEPVIFWKHTGRSYQEITQTHGLTANEFISRVAISPNYDQAREKREQSLEG